MRAHGEPQHEIGQEFFGDDPDLALVNANMAAYMEAHPCLARTDEEEELCVGTRVCRCAPGGDDAS